MASQACPVVTGHMQGKPDGPVRRGSDRENAYSSRMRRSCILRDEPCETREPFSFSYQNPYYGF